MRLQSNNQANNNNKDKQDKKQNIVYINIKQDNMDVLFPCNF